MQARLPQLLLGGLENPMQHAHLAFWTFVPVQRREHFHALQGISISAVRGRAAWLTEPTAAGEKRIIVSIFRPRRRNRVGYSRARETTATWSLAPSLTFRNSRFLKEKKKKQNWHFPLRFVWYLSGNREPASFNGENHCAMLFFSFSFFNLMNAPHDQLFINWPSFAKRTSADKVTGDRTQHTAPSLGCSWRGIQSRWRWTKRLPWLRFMKALFTLKLEPLWRRESLLFGWCCAGLIYWLLEKNAKSSDSPKPMNTTSK